MSEARKYDYCPVIQGYYSPYGWEDVSEYEHGQCSEAVQDIKEYRLSADAPHRLITRRTLRSVFDPRLASLDEEPTR